jgi:hypothetical protein
LQRPRKKKLRGGARSTPIYQRQLKSNSSRLKEKDKATMPNYFSIKPLIFRSKITVDHSPTPNSPK